MDETKEPRHETRIEAARAGRIKFLGGPCRNCGNELRYTSAGNCVACAKQARADYNDMVREALREATGR